MILLKKFIEPTFATGKIVEASFRYNNSLKKEYLDTINIKGLYLYVKELYRDIIFPFSHFYYNIKEQNGKEIISAPLFTDCRNHHDFTRKIRKNNKNIKLSIDICMSCFSDNVELLIGENLCYSHTYKYVYYCVDCRLINDFKRTNGNKVKNLCNTANVIKSYTRYLKLCN